jgi:uncharacterized protein
MISPQPVAEKERIVSIDVLRGFAVLGILLMNIQYFSMIGAAYFNPTVYGDLHGANFLVWLLSRLLADGKFVSIFCMLFGAGIVLMTGRAEAAGTNPALLHFRRMAWLMVFGLLHAHLLWAGDILFDYGVCGLVAYPFRRLRPRALLTIGLLSMAVAPAVTRSMENWAPAQLQSFREQFWQPTPAMIAREVADYGGGWRDQMRQRVPDALGSETFGFVFSSFWHEEGLMLIGMALFKLHIFSAQQPSWQYRGMAAAGLGLGIPVTLYGVWHEYATGWSFPSSFCHDVRFTYWAGLLTSLGWIGCVMLACRAGVLPRFASRLAAVGRMAFTNYILQTVICTSIFYGHGLGLFGKVERVWQLAIVVAVWVVQLTLSPLWLRHFQFGPLEWLWRTLTYARRAPFRRVAYAIV